MENRVAEGRDKKLRASILHRKGCDAETIAKKLELPLNRVELWVNEVFPRMETEAKKLFG